MSDTADFESIQNHYEQPVLAAVRDRAAGYPGLRREMLADVACVALNRLPPRYIRHPVDLAFYMTDKERVDNERAIDEAVTHAFEFVQARAAMRARR
ncbi:late competence development ComFB family protein [Ideonella sp. BN130291]|uniref:late competence development ComFB family protein n=1 Tax=Ideonella sp. BN130291 TaxID=3112940 RepID=UPI002E25A193|nr:late competence development ComFB family protein [Ideonella sp. BN130291]